jgi:hypothetical protein
MKLNESKPLLNCFDSDNWVDRLDRKSFKFTHKLLEHPALSLENLAKVIPSLPQKHVFYSKGLMKTEDSFEQSPRHRPKDFSIEDEIETIRVSGSFIIVKSPEMDRSFVSPYQELVTDILMRLRGVGDKAITPKPYLFIAFPNSITP